MKKTKKTYNSDAGYSEKRDKNGDIVAFRVGDKKHYIEFSFKK